MHTTKMYMQRINLIVVGILIVVLFPLTLLALAFLGMVYVTEFVIDSFSDEYGEEPFC